MFDFFTNFIISAVSQLSIIQYLYGSALFLGVMLLCKKLVFYR